MRRPCDLCRDVLRHPLDVGGRTGPARALGDRIGHLLDVAEARIVKNKHLRHLSLLKDAVCGSRTLRHAALNRIAVAVSQRPLSRPSIRPILNGRSIATASNGRWERRPHRHHARPRQTHQGCSCGRVAAALLLDDDTGSRLASGPMSEAASWNVKSFGYEGSSGHPSGGQQRVERLDRRPKSSRAFGKSSNSQAAVGFAACPLHHAARGPPPPFR